MFVALPVAGDIAVSLSLSDRTETRVRDPGDDPGRASLDVTTTPDLRLTLASPHATCAVAYDPQLTLWNITNVSIRPLWLQMGSARLEWHDEDVVLWLEQAASYGATNFSALTYPSNPVGTPETSPRVDAIPPSQIVQYESSTTSLGVRAALHRWELRSSLGYALSGGADAGARSVIPLQTGPLAEGDVTYATSPVDHFGTTVTASETTFSSGPMILLGEGDEGWKHRWSPWTDTDFALGVSDSRIRQSSLVDDRNEPRPVVEAIVEQRAWSDGNRATFRVDARLGPVVNRLLGTVDQCLQGTLSSTWAHGPLGVSAFATAQQSVPTNEAYAISLFTGNLAMSYAMFDGVLVDWGVRGLWQKADQPVGSLSMPDSTNVVASTLVQGMVFVGVTLRAPTIRL